MRKLWCEFTTQIGKLKVYILKDESVLGNDGQECQGTFNPDANVIEIAFCTNAMRMYQTLHHELLHVCFTGHGCDFKEKLFGKDADKREEYFISFIEPIQFDLMVRNKLLNYPAIPKIFWKHLR